jgi:DNA recombination protein RmuC
MAGMDLLIAFVLGAVFAALLIWSVRRSDGSGASRDPALAELQQAVQRLEVSHADVRGAVGTQLTTLLNAQSDVLRQTGRLSEALRRPGVRGQWGELTLTNLCEAAGMAEHIDYDTQTHMRGTGVHETAVRPDLVVRLPGGGNVCVDAKAPLDAFLDATEEESPAAQNDALDRHVQQVRTKMRALASKAYWERFNRAPEMVVMFIPSEAAFAAAVQRDPSLIEDAARSKVVIATPSTMLALLQVVALGWREAALSKNAEEIRRRSTELVQRLVIFNRHLTDMGKALDKTVRAHNKAISSYDGRLLVTARRLGDLGISEAAAIQGPPQVETAVHVRPSHDPDPPVMAAPDLEASREHVPRVATAPEGEA